MRGYAGAGDRFNLDSGIESPGSGSFSSVAPMCGVVILFWGGPA